MNQTANDFLVARWRQPVIPLAVTDEPTVVSVLNGKERVEIRTRFKPADIERFRTGYCCLECWEPHEHPFPEQCSLCGYRMRDRQAADFARLFKGPERDPRAVRLEQEQDRVDDTHERNFHVTTSGIVIPKGV